MMQSFASDPGLRNNNIRNTGHESTELFYATNDKSSECPLVIRTANPAVLDALGISLLGFCNRFFFKAK